jgi:hypothetical protein
MINLTAAQAGGMFLANCTAVKSLHMKRTGVASAGKK